MIRRPPRFTLFPSATLSESVRLGALPAEGAVLDHLLGVVPGAAGVGEEHRHQRAGGAGQCWRSEEHTSELQSRQYLVCRLLLEKKRQEFQAFILSIFQELSS